MNQAVTNQAYALSGVAMAATLVNAIATGKPLDRTAYETLISSLFVQNPTNALNVYGDNEANLSIGAHTAENVLSSHGENVKAQVQYMLGIIELQKQLTKAPQHLDYIDERMERIEWLRSSHGETDPSVIRALADVYQNTVSTYRLRIKVIGTPEILQQPSNAEKIRALLLAGIRSATLWRQLGGRKFHLLTRKRSLKAEFYRIHQLENLIE